MGQHETNGSLDCIEKLLGVPAIKLEPGFSLQNRYRIEKKLGAGGMASVYQAMDLQKRSRVAIKQLVVADSEEKDRIAKRLEREYHFLQTLSHPNLVKAYDFFHERSCFFLVLEYVVGQSMKQVLDAGRESLSLLEQLAIGSQLCWVVDALNAIGILHRDLKPANIMLDLVNGQVKLLDLGLGKSLSSQSDCLTGTGAALGTPAYMSPEQIQGGTSERMDIFSLGVTLYQFFLWQTQSPFHAETSVNTMVRIASQELPPLLDCIDRHLPDGERQVYRALSRTLAQSLVKQPQHRLAGASLLAQCIDEQYDFLKKSMSRHKDNSTFQTGMSLVTSLSPEQIAILRNMRAGFDTDTSGSSTPRKSSSRIAKAKADKADDGAHADHKKSDSRIAKANKADDGAHADHKKSGSRIAKANKADDGAHADHKKSGSRIAKLRQPRARADSKTWIIGGTVLCCMVFSALIAFCRSAPPQASSTQIQMEDSRQPIHQQTPENPLPKQQQPTNSTSATTENSGQPEEQAIRLRTDVATDSEQPGNQVTTEQITSWCLEGFSRYQQGQYAQAEQLYLRATRYCQLPSNAYMVLAISQCQLGKIDQAEQTLLQTIRLYPEDSQPYINLGWVYMQSNKIKKAQQMLERAIALGAQNGEAYVNLGILYQQDGRLREAINMFAQALALAPSGVTNSQQEQNTLAQAIAKTPYMQDAIGKLEIVYRGLLDKLQQRSALPAKEDENDSIRLVEVYLWLGNLEQAGKLLRLLTARCPDSPLAIPILKLYLKQYPNGKDAEMARAALARLQQKK